MFILFHLLSLSCLGADRLKRQIQLVARQNNVTNKDSPIWPLLAAVAAVSTPKGLMRDIAAAVNEDGQLADSASEQVTALSLSFLLIFLSCLLLFCVMFVTFSCLTCFWCGMRSQNFAAVTGIRD